MRLTSKSTQSGVTLVELMIALVLGLIIAAGLSQIFVSSQKTYRITEEQSRLQESARFGFEFITRGFREAGYSGCRAIERLNIQVIANAPTVSYNANNIVSGSEASLTSPGTWSPALNSDIEDDVIAGTDTLSIQKAGSCGGTLTQQGQSNSSTSEIKIPTSNSCNISAGDVLMLTDCEHAHIFRANSNSNNPGNSGNSDETISIAASMNSSTHFCLNQANAGTGSCGTGNAKLYGSDAELLTFSSLTYYIGTGAGGRNALFVYDGTASSKTELVEGVEDMQIQYGVDADENDIVDNYQTAETVNTAGNWDKVISAEISILLTTQKDNLTTAEQTFIYNGTTVNASDKRLHHVYTTVISIRNRVQ
ncbi:MAG: PilW family protein [Cycloclasticus sp.]